MLCLFHFLDKHKKEADEEQDAGNPDGFWAVGYGKSAANSCADGKQKNDGEVAQCLMKQSWLLFPHVGGKGCGAASKVSDAHGAGISVSFYLTEGLYLQGAGEGYQSGRKNIHVPRYEAYQEQQDNFYQKDSLAPVKASGIAEFFLNAFR